MDRTLFVCTNCLPQRKEKLLVCWDEILKFYSGTELKSHFEKIKDGQISASIKPQQVYDITQVFDGTGTVSYTHLTLPTILLV